MIDRLSQSIQELLRVQTEDELYDAAVAGLSHILDADQLTAVPAAECTGTSQAWASTDSLDLPGQEPLVSGLIGQSYASEDSIVIEDLSQTRSASAQTSLSDPGRYRSLLCVPVTDWGVLVAVAPEAAAFSAEDLEAVEHLGSFVTAAASRISSSDSSDTHERSEDHIQEITSILSHDLRNPLMVANGQVSLARKKQSSEHLDKAAMALDRLEELLDDVELFARTGEAIEATEWVPVQAVAERAWAMGDAADAELTVVNSLTIRADESRLCQLFENLFCNAVTHGGPAVTVQVGVLPDRQGFYVEDDGSGIPAPDPDIIFDRGYSSDTDGTGLGLFIVEKIAHAHEWDIIAAGSEAGGARFEITGVETKAR